MKDIWEQIFKPDKFANSQPSDLFQIEFYEIPHMFYYEKEFYERMEELKCRFDLGVTASLFLSDSD